MGWTINVRERMKMPKKRNKKFNIIKSIANESKFLLKDKCVVYIDKVTNPHVLHDIKLNKQVKVDYKTYIALKKLWQNWSIECAVFLRHKNGTCEVASANVSPPKPCAHDQIHGSCRSAHIDYIEEIKAKYPQNICGVGWVAVPQGYELDDETLDAILTKYGAFKFLAPWQD